MCGSGSVCYVFRDQHSNRIIQHCVYSPLVWLGCAYHNYNTIDRGRSFCCVEDFCNSKEKFLEFRGNLSTTTTNNVGQVTSSITIYNVGQATSSTSKLTSASSYNVGQATSSTSKLTRASSYNVGQATSSTSELTSTTSWIPTASPTGELIFSL